MESRDWGVFSPRTCIVIFYLRERPYKPLHHRPEEENVVTELNLHTVLPSNMVLNCSQKWESGHAIDGYATTLLRGGNSSNHKKELRSAEIWCSFSCVQHLAAPQLQVEHHIENPTFLNDLDDHGFRNIRHFENISNNISQRCKKQ